jgi:hypothetical protein
VTDDRFLFLDDALAAEFNVGRDYLVKIAEAQSGVFKRKPYSDACLASYPKFVKGPGGRWGIFESQRAEYWQRLRLKATNVLEFHDRFSGRKGKSNVG